MFTYDGNGNTLSKVNSAGTTQYTWDFENRLTSVVLPGTGGTVAFKYDPFGRRIQKSSASGTTDYLYDGSNSVEEIDQAAGALLARYAQSIGIDEPLAESRVGTSGFYEQDGLGSVTSLSGSAGSLADTYTYNSFGVSTASAGTLGNPFQYTGRDYDSETGLRYYRARYYESSIGRFISEDPLHFAADNNFYRYVESNPVRFRDPSGQSAGTLVPPLVAGGTTTVCFASGVCEILAIAAGGAVIVVAIYYLANSSVLNPAIESDGRKRPQFRCGKNEVICNYVGEFKSPGVDPVFKICIYSCSDGIGRSIPVPINFPCLLIQKGPWGIPW
jgi:RHS repeat-associated protein